MPLVEVTLTEGRSPQTLRTLIDELTEAVVDSGAAPRSSVRVIVREVPATHFAAGGETLAERKERQQAEQAGAQPAEQQNPKGNQA